MPGAGVSHQRHAAEGVPDFLQGEGTAKALMRGADWHASPLGPVARWPQSLKTTLGILLHSKHPMLLLWGPQLLRFYNDAFLPSLGHEREPPPIGQPAAESWRDIWPLVWPQIDEVMRHGKSSWSEDRLVPISRNGRVEDVYWSYGPSPVFDEAGAIAGTLIVCTETTERVLADRRQQALHRLVEATVGCADALEVIRQAGRVLEEAAADIPFAAVYAGQGGDAPALKVHASGLDDAAARQVDAAVQAGLNNTPAAPADGENGRPLAARGVVVELPEAAGVPSHAMYVVSAAGGTGRRGDAIAFGLSARLPFDDAYRNFLDQFATNFGLALVRVQAARLRASSHNERDKLLLQAPVAAAVLAGPKHVLQLANKPFCDVLGRQDVVGRPYLEAFPEQAGTPLVLAMDGVYAGGRRHITGETPVRLARRDGGLPEDCYFRFHLEPVRNSLGRVFGMMVIAVDITEQVRARQVLEHTDRERTRMVAELESASRAKDEFLAMLGHELRNPLSPIVMALQLMRLRGDTGTGREQAIIQRQVDHLIRLVDDLLDVSKITRGKVELRCEDLEIADVLAKAVEMASVLLEQRNHQLSIEVNRQGLPWRGDGVRLAQVVANLLTNAARYTPSGGRIALRAWRDASEICISVGDNGIGIAPDLLPRIFDLFVQGHRGADRSEGGLGIGLALVKNLVTLHGGTVHAHSDGAGCGSTFTIRLPGMTPPALGLAAPTDAPASPPVTRVRAKRVLVVDDNRDAGDSLADVLRALGHSVCVATDPLEGLALAGEFEPQVAVLDIGLPGMDGYELAGRMRARLGAAGCRLIALTGYGQDHDRQRSHDAGFDAHLVKPADMAQLGRLLDDLAAP
jgi:signal transduction histidine kinase